jgi:hypothetical protein
MNYGGEEERERAHERESRKLSFTAAKLCINHKTESKLLVCVKEIDESEFFNKTIVLRVLTTRNYVRAAVLCLIGRRNANLSFKANFHTSFLLPLAHSASQLHRA